MCIIRWPTHASHVSLPHNQSLQYQQHPPPYSNLPHQYIPNYPCANCNGRQAVVNCAECGHFFCELCDRSVHEFKVLSKHNRDTILATNQMNNQPLNPQLQTPYAATQHPHEQIIGLQYHQQDNMILQTTAFSGAAQPIPVAFAVALPFESNQTS